MNVRKILPLFLSLSILVIFTAGCGDNETLSASYPYYDGIDALAERASDIISGKVVGSPIKKKISVGGDSSFWYNIFTIEVEEVYKGNCKPGDMKEIKILRNEESCAKVSEKLKDFNKETSLIFFLESYDSAQASLLNPQQAVCSLRSEKVIGEDGNIEINLSELSEEEMALRDFSPIYPDELQEIKEKYSQSHE